MQLINRILEEMKARRDVFYLYWSPMKAVPDRLRSHFGPIILDGKMDIYVTSVVSIIRISRIIQLKNLKPSCGQPYQLAKFKEAESDYIYVRYIYILSINHLTVHRNRLTIIL